MPEVANLFTSLTLESSSFVVGLKKAVDVSATASVKIERHLNTIVTAGKAIAGGAVANQILQFAQSGLDYASSLGEVSQQLGVTTADLQVYGYAATQVGIDQDTMEKGLAKLTKTMGEAAAGAKGPVTTFRDLGISIRDSNGNLLTAGEVIPRIADALSKVQDPAVRARIETQLFGKAGQQLDTLLAGGSGAIDELRRAAYDLGIVLSDKQIQSADATADKLSEVKTVLEARIAGVVADNADAVFKLADAFERLVSKIDPAINALIEYRLKASRTLAELSLDFDKAQRFDDQLKQRQSDRSTAGLNKQFPLSKIIPPTPPKGAGGFEQEDDGGAAARKAAKDAERAAQEARQRADRSQAEIARADDELLGLKQQLTVDAREYARLAHLQIERAAATRDRELEIAVRDQQITAAAAAEVKEREARADDLRHAAVNRELDEKLDREALDLRTAEIGEARDRLEAQRGLASTAAERRSIELRLLDLQYQEERARLEAILAARDATEAEKEIARRRLAALDELQPTAAAGVRAATRGPAESYLAGIYKTAAEKAEDFEASTVDGLRSVEDAVTSTATSVLKLGGVFGDVANSIISDLIRIAVQQNVTGPLAKLLFGGSALASGNVGFSGIGGTSLADTIKLAPLSLPGLASGGTIGGIGGIDRNILSINGMPVARVGRGEMLRVEPNNDTDGGRLIIEPSPWFDIRAAGAAEPSIQSMGARAAAGGSAMAQRGIARRGRQQLGRR